jgi:uncharacterized membrane protein
MSPVEFNDADISPGRASFDARVLPWIEAFVLFVSSHWLALTNLSLALFAGLPLLAPILASTGNPVLDAAGRAIFFAYRATCHQLPERSFFILGHQVAWCERDTAIWGSVLVGGLLFSLLRRKLGQLDLRLYALFCVPMAVDGVTQLLGFRQSNWELRTITGTIFGLASVWLVFPILERGMGEVRESLAASRGRR